MLSIWIGIIGNIDKASTKIVDTSLLSQLRQAAAWGRAINIELHAQFPMPAPSSTSSLDARRRRRRKKIFSMQVFHSLPNIVLLVMTQISDTLPLGH